MHSFGRSVFDLSVSGFLPARSEGAGPPKRKTKTKHIFCPLPRSQVPVERDGSLTLTLTLTLTLNLTLTLTLHAMLHVRRGDSNASEALPLVHCCVGSAFSFGWTHLNQCSTMVKPQQHMVAV